ncbi:hypothetical protein FACS1894189_2120 [Planctomycetales bacterium]|nr:hypothetical protein FACS1894189_2120 [Planctomycetales bacterium]
MSAMKSALKPAGPAATVIAVWEPAVDTSGEKPTRGFGGRIYFYDQEATRPVKIHGTVVVYAFDEEGRSAEDTKPSEGYVFDDKILNSNGVYKKSKLGPSYNLWVPWDTEGPDGKAKKVSLIVRYIPKKGGASVVSSQASAYLPGRNDRNTQIAANREIKDPNQPGAVQQVSFLAEKVQTEMEKNPNQLTKEHVIEENENRPQALQSITIR